MGCCAYPMRGVSADRGSPPPQRPAGRRNGSTALMAAAFNDHHAIVGKLVVARADLNAKNNYSGCAPSPRPVRRPRRSPTLPIAPAPSVRFTALHYAAWKGSAYIGSTKSAVALLVGGADHTITANNG
jgi:hypothetical protein